MQITEQFNVASPVDIVWQLFANVPELARCLPGAELTGDNDDGTYDGRVTVKLGPISASFDGRATISFDNDTHRATITGRGVDRTGGNQGSVDVAVDLTDIDGNHTKATIAATITLAGPIAQFGRTGLVAEVSKRLIDEFSDCLHAKLEAESPEEAVAVEAAPVRGLSLFFSTAFTAFTRWFRNLFRRNND